MAKQKKQDEKPQVVKTTRKGREARADYLNPAVCREAGSKAPARARRINARRMKLRGGESVQDVSREMVKQDAEMRSTGRSVRNRKTFARTLNISSGRTVYKAPRIDAGFGLGVQ